MKILVDEMPKDQEHCPYVNFEPASWWCPSCYICTYRSPEALCQGVDKCYFFMSFEDYKNRTYRSIDGTIGI